MVRVKGFAPEAVWSRRYRHIREFERMLGDEGTHVVKLFLNVSSDEQRARLQDRIDDPDERWKFRLGDLDDRALWDEFFINRDWPVASAVSVVLLLILVLPMMWFQKTQAGRAERRLV